VLLQKIDQQNSGGRLQKLLPLNRGRVLCGCLAPALNACALYKIDIGDLAACRSIVQQARLLFEQATEILVFFKQGPVKWDYQMMKIVTKTFSQ
jgi:hypothetical protein